LLALLSARATTTMIAHCDQATRLPRLDFVEEVRGAPPWTRYSDSSDGAELAGAGAGVLLRAPRVLAPLAGARLARAAARGAAVFFGAAARLPADFALRFGAAFLAGFLAAARFVVFLAAARFGAAFFAAFRAGFFATFPAFAAAGFFADLVTFFAGFFAVFAVFLAAIGNPPACAPAVTGIAERPRRYNSSPRQQMLHDVYCHAW
jgi:hypothetical protein